jgi:serine/threonine-protein kinase RsbW
MSNLLEQSCIQQSHLRVKTDLNEITQVLEWFGKFDNLCVIDRVLMYAKIALAEGFTNAVRHAHQHRHPDTPIDIYAFVFPHYLEVCIWDEGEAFDLANLMDTVEQQYPNLLEHEEHWGGTIFKKLSTDYGWKIHYRCPAAPGSDRNCLTLQIPFYSRLED